MNRRPRSVHWLGGCPNATGATTTHDPAQVTCRPCLRLAAPSSECARDRLAALTADSTRHVQAKQYRDLTERERRSIVAAHGSEATTRELCGRFGIGDDRILAVWREAGLGPRVRGPAVDYGRLRPKGAKR